MQIVIEIPDKIYEKVKEHYVNPYEVDEICQAILDGTPLPEGHGDLIDRDALELDADWNDYYDGFGAYSESQVRCAPTIIEEVKADERMA